MLVDDSTRLAAKASAAAAAVTLEVNDGALHVWHVFASLLPEGQQAIEGIGESV